jgi:hypothetical protein
LDCFGQGKYVGGLFLIFTHRFRGFFCLSNYIEAPEPAMVTFDHAGTVVAVFLDLAASQ